MKTWYRSRRSAWPLSSTISAALLALVGIAGCGDRPSPLEPVSVADVVTSVNGMATVVEGPTVWTGKEDYVPDEIVDMFGSGWSPGETVELTLVENPHVHGDRTFTAITDTLGFFEFEGFRPDAGHAFVTFTLTAVGQSSGYQAETTFTDGIAQGGVASNSNSSGTTASRQLTINAPAIAAGQFMIAQIVVNKDLGSGLICPPSSDWISILRTSRSSGVYVQETFYRTAPAVAQSYTWTFRGTNCTTGSLIGGKGASGGVILYDGVDTSAPIRAFGGANGSSSNPPEYRAPSVAAEPGDMVLRYFGVEKNTTVASATSTPAATYLQRSSSPVERAAAAFQIAHTTGTTSGSFDASFGTSSEWTAQTIVLRMAPVAPTCSAVSMTTHPSAQSITYGANAAFTAAASGDPAPSVQWQVNGGGGWVNVPGATNATLTLTKPAVSQSGNQFRAVFTNECGGTQSVTSNAASLSIASLGITGSFAVADKVYDGDTDGTIVVSSPSLTGALSGDVVNLVPGTASFASRNVGTHAITGVGFGLSGGAAGNYTLQSVSAPDAEITAKPLTVSGITAADKSWDGTTAASVNVTGATLADVVAGDDVTLNTGAASGAFANSSVGTHAVTVSGLTISGDDAGNYSLTQPSTSASILAWNAAGHGFYQPVGVPNSIFVAAPGLMPVANGLTVWNIARGGSTIPLKFNVFAGAVEKTSVADIDRFSAVKLAACGVVEGTGDEVDFVTSGATSLRYDAEDAQFVQNWKSPAAKTDTCYRVSVIFLDGSSLSAFFKLRK